MQILTPLRHSVDLIVENPVVITLTFLFTALSAAFAGAQYFTPILALPSTLAQYIIAPFFIGGLIAVIDECIDGTGSTATFIEGGKQHYLSILGGGLILFVAFTAVYLIVFVVFGVLGMVVMFTLESVSSLVVLFLVGLLALVAFVIVLIPFIALQFFPALVVIDGYGTMESARESIELVNANLKRVLVFDLVVSLISAVTLVPVIYLLVQLSQTSTQGQSVGETVFSMLSLSELFAYLTPIQFMTYLGLSVVTGTIIGPVIYSYYVTYYRQFPESDRRPETAQAGDQTA